MGKTEKAGLITSPKASVIDSLGISLIVWIDDQFVPTVEQALNLLKELMDSGYEDECRAALGGSQDEDLENWLPELWRDSPVKQRMDIIDALLRINSDIGQAFETMEYSSLSANFETKAEMFKLPPSLFGNVESIVRGHLAASPENMVLCLFDERLDNDTEVATSGVALMHQAINALGTSRVVYGLFSQAFKYDEELTKGKELIRTEGIPLNQAIPLSKDRLESSASLGEGIRLSLLMFASARLTREVAIAHEAAIDTTRRTLEDLTVVDFYSAVIKTSADEGVREVDTLTRLFGVYNGNNLRRELAARTVSLDRWVGFINEYLTKDGPESAVVSPGASVKHNRAEHFDLDLNEFHAAIDLGDVFQMDGDGQLYVLIAQPCDIALRKNGKRSARSATLAAVSLEAPEENQKHVTDELNYFDDEGGKAYVKFKKLLPISFDVLDLAAFNTDGQCKIDLSKSCPTEMPKSLQRRFEFLRKSFEHQTQEMRTTLAALKDIKDSTVRARLEQQATLCSGMPCRCENGLVTFGLKRISRYRQPRASILLQKWANFASRPATEREFS